MSTQTVFLVDDDLAVRDSLGMFLEANGLDVESFDSAESFLAAYRRDRAGCMVLDVRMKRMNGLELQEELMRRDCRLPIIFLTGHGDIPMTVRAMRAGAADVLTKPVSVTALLEKIRAVLQDDARQREWRARGATCQHRLDCLTPRETEIMALMVEGLSSKAIAKELGISYRTVETHRSRILHKTGTDSVLELSRLTAECGLREIRPA